MRKLFFVLIAIACLTAVCAGQVVEEIIARVNNQIITRSEFLRSKDQLKDDVKQQAPADPDKVYAEREKDILRDLIDQDLLLDKGAAKQRRDRRRAFRDDRRPARGSPSPAAVPPSSRAGSRSPTITSSKREVCIMLLW